jgi:hypothetical protein
MVKRVIDRCKKIIRSDLMWAACTLGQIDRSNWGSIGTKARTKKLQERTSNTAILAED